MRYRHHRILIIIIYISIDEWIEKYYIAPATQQLLLAKSELKYLKARIHGGCSPVGRRKTKRPLIPRAATHLVLKSSKAQGRLSFYAHKKLVHGPLKQKAGKFFVEILDFVNMGNHLHMKVRFKDAQRFQQFVKSYTALLARMITGARKGKPFGRFWDGLAYTRVLTSKLEVFGLRIYFEGNHREREMGRAQRDFYLKGWNQFLCKLRTGRQAIRFSLKTNSANNYSSKIYSSGLRGTSFRRTS